MVVGRLCEAALPLFYETFRRLIESAYRGSVFTGRSLRQVGLAHQIAITFSRRAPAFVEGPHDKALAAAAVAGGEHAFDAGRIRVVLSLGVGTLIAFDAE